MNWRRRGQTRPVRRKGRSLFIWGLALWLVALAAIDLARGVTLWRARPLLGELESRLSGTALVIYVALFACCAAGLAIAAVGIARCREWGRKAACAIMILNWLAYQSYVWLFVRSGLLWERRWVSLIVSLICTAIMVGVLTWPRSRKWLGLVER
jgi:hypothetical protein